MNVLLIQKIVNELNGISINDGISAASLYAQKMKTRTLLEEIE